MDAIRRMLDDLKRSTDEGPEPESEVRPASRPEATMRRREDDEVLEDSGDPLRSRIDRIGKEGRAGREAAPPSNYDAAKLRKMHEKRAKRLQKARERKRRSGAFVSGFTLVAVVTATMVGLYVLRPQIVASSPEMAPAMNEYVVAVDRYRIALDDATAGMRAWVAARVEPLLGGEEGGARDTPPATEPATTTE
ncbi:MAG TPA: hypothetical protein VMM59_01250 [Thermohalobaculum sp.]|nr:hypothetical protein [Thermohalobaculum sp.]